MHNLAGTPLAQPQGFTFPIQLEGSWYDACHIYGDPITGGAGALPIVFDRRESMPLSTVCILNFPMPSAADNYESKKYMNAAYKAASTQKSILWDRENEF